MDAPTTKSCFVFISPPFASLSVLLVGDLLHPVDVLAVEGFLNGNVGHSSCRRGAVPVLQPGRKPHNIAGPHLLDGAAVALHPSQSRCDDQRLPERMRMPSSPGTRLEGDMAGAGACRIGR